jgi:acyl carrier protein
MIQGLSDEMVLARVRSLVRDVLKRRLPVVELLRNVTFHDLRVDAFDRVYIADAIEREWNIQLNEEEIRNWTRVEDVARCVIAHRRC